MVRAFESCHIGWGTIMPPLDVSECIFCRLRHLSLRSTVRSGAAAAQNDATTKAEVYMVSTTNPDSNASRLRPTIGAKL
mgnify:CR=1 FL=1